MNSLIESLERYLKVKDQPKPEEDSERKDRLIEEMRAFSDLKRSYLEFKNGNSDSIN